MEGKLTVNWLGQVAYGGVATGLLLLMLFVRLVRDSLTLLRTDVTRRFGVVLIGYLVATLVSTQFYPGDTLMFWVLLGTASAILVTLNNEAARMRKKNLLGAGL